MPPSLRVRVGVPPETVTASFKFTVRVTTLPTPMSPEPAVMPVPEATTDDTEGVVVSICSVPAGLVTAPGEVSRGAGAVRDGGRVEVDRGDRQVGGVLAGRNRVAEGQRIGAGAAGIGRGAAVVESQRRRTARNRHRLAHIERQRYHTADTNVARAGRDTAARRND